MKEQTSASCLNLLFHSFLRFKKSIKPRWSSQGCVKCWLTSSECTCAFHQAMLKQMEACGTTNPTSSQILWSRQLQVRSWQTSKNSIRDDHFAGAVANLCDNCPYNRRMFGLSNTLKMSNLLVYILNAYSRLSFEIVFNIVCALCHLCSNSTENIRLFIS